MGAEARASRATSLAPTAPAGSTRRPQWGRRQGLTPGTVPWPPYTWWQEHAHAHTQTHYISRQTVKPLFQSSCDSFEARQCILTVLGIFRLLSLGSHVGGYRETSPLCLEFAFLFLLKKTSSIFSRPPQLFIHLPRWYVYYSLWHIFKMSANYRALENSFNDLGKILDQITDL